MRFFRKSHAWRANFADEARLTGERILVPPEPAIYRGGDKPHSAVKGNGHIALTNRRIVFCKLTGGIEEVPIDQIVGTRRAKWFRKARRGNKEHFIVETNTSGEVGFFVRDIDAWEKAFAVARR